MDILKRALRIISILIGVGAFVTAMRFAFTPAAAADRLGMSVLEGVGASTQPAYGLARLKSPGELSLRAL